MYLLLSLSGSSCYDDGVSSVVANGAQVGSSRAPHASMGQSFLEDMNYPRTSALPFPAHTDARTHSKCFNIDMAQRVMLLLCQFQNTLNWGKGRPLEIRIDEGRDNMFDHYVRCLHTGAITWCTFVDSSWPSYNW
jgi:hypothetical protein